MMIALSVAVPIPLRLNSPKAGSRPRPGHQRHRGGDEVVRLGEIDGASTQILPAVAVISPMTTIDRPPVAGVGAVVTRAPNFGDRPSTTEITPASNRCR